MDPSSSTGSRLAGQAGRLSMLLRHLASPAIRRRVEVEDMLQEVFLRALTVDAGLPDDDQALWALLRHIARNTVVDIARAMRAKKRDAPELRLDASAWSRSVNLDPAARSHGPATRFAKAETQSRLQEAFQALDPDHRRVIGFRQFEGLSAEATGARMGRSASAIHSLYRRALQAWHGLLPDDLKDSC